MQDKVFVDSNIFLYAFSDLDLRKQKIASQIVSQGNCVISSQVLNEVSSVCKDTFLKACELRENYNFSYFDSLIVASASLEGCHRLYSEDMQHGLVLSNQTTIVNPFITT